MTERETILNKIAQNHILSEKGIELYDSLSKSDKEELFNTLLFFMTQAYPDKESIENGIKNSFIKNTMTPCVIFLKNTLNNAKNKIQKLDSEKEKRKAFIVMLSIFKEADSKRRNTHCKNGCSHYWHNTNPH